MNQDHSKIKQYYNQIYYKNVDIGGQPSRHLIRLAKRLNISPGQHILDVACGTGSWLKACSLRGAKVTGVDISDKAIKICTESLPEGVFFASASERLPLPEKHFDLVSCLGSLEHFLDQPAALREMLRVAKPEGRLLILVPNAGFLTYQLGLYKGTQQQEVRETIHTLEDWKAMFENNGIEVYERWKDLHVFNKDWLFRSPIYMALPRLAQAFALMVWPLRWQYQVYHLCRRHGKN